MAGDTHTHTHTKSGALPLRSSKHNKGELGSSRNVTNGNVKLENFVPLGALRGKTFAGFRASTFAGCDNCTERLSAVVDSSLHIHLDSQRASGYTQQLPEHTHLQVLRCVGILGREDLDFVCVLYFEDGGKLGGVPAGGGSGAGPFSRQLSGQWQRERDTLYTYHRELGCPAADWHTLVG